MYLDTLATTVATQCYHLLHYNLTKITPELLVNLIYNVQLFYKMVPFHNRELQTFSSWNAGSLQYVLKVFQTLNSMVDCDGSIC